MSNGLHRVTWFAPDRPTGGTVYVKPPHRDEEHDMTRQQLLEFIDAAHGLICNAHQKRVDDVTNEDGASLGWAEAARRWIDAYPPAS